MIDELMAAARLAEELSVPRRGMECEVTIEVKADQLVVKGRLNTGTSWRHTSHHVGWPVFITGPHTLEAGLRHVGRVLDRTADMEAE